MGSQSSKVLPDAVFGSPLSHAFSSRDERIKMADNASIPYCWTCRLVIETIHGKKYTSNGFKLNLGSTALDKQVIITTAHSLYIQGAYARKITIYFPHCDPQEVTNRRQLWAAPEYISLSSPKHDYGFILLSGSSNEGFGWTTLLTNQELLGRPLTTCGYSSDDPDGHLWITAGGVENVNNYHINFMQDSLGTGSGSPVYTWYKGYWTIVGLQGFGGACNTVIRLTPNVMYNIFNVLGYSPTYVIQPQSLPNVHLKVDTSTENNTIVTCSHDKGTHFVIYPLQSEPSSGQWSTINTPLVIKGLCIDNDAIHSQDSMINSLYIVHYNDDESVSFESLFSDDTYLSLSDEEDSVMIKQTVVYKKTKLGPREKFLLSLVQKD